MNRPAIASGLAAYHACVTEQDTGDRRQRVAYAMEVAALELFATHGYHDVTIEQIAAAVGVHQRTVLRYFRSKEDILLTLPRRAGRAICDEIVDRPPTETPIEATCQAVLEAGKTHDYDNELSLTWAKAVATCPEAFVAVTAEFMHDMAGTISARLAPSAGREVARAMAWAIAGAVHGLWREWIDDGGTADFAELTCRGLRVLESVTTMSETSLLDELARLRHENEELRIERELFKHAAAALLERSSNDDHRVT